MSDRAMRRVVAATLECGHEYIGAPANGEARCVACENAERKLTREERAVLDSEDLLRVSLAFAVPLWVQRFIDEKRTSKQVLAEARRAGELISSQGDTLMFRSKARPARKVSGFSAPEDLEPGYKPSSGDLSRGAGTAAVFNALAAGLAAASFQPGGVKAFGNHFESKPEWLEGKS